MQRRQRDHDASIPLSPSLLHLPRGAGMTPRVRAGTPEDLDELAALFDQYRQFYGQPPDLVLAREFIGQRLARGDSRLLIAQGAGTRIIAVPNDYTRTNDFSAANVVVDGLDAVTIELIRQLTALRDGGAAQAGGPKTT